MNGLKVWAGVVVIGALAVSASLASAAGPAVPASAHRASAPNASAAVHTATTHHRVHRHHRAPGAVIATNRLAPIRAVDFPSEPSIPQRQRPHRATMPVLAQMTRHAPTSRYGPRHAPAAPGQFSTVVPEPRALVTQRDAILDPRILTVSGGRGPPRGSPDGPSRGRATPAPASAEDPDACGPASRTITRFALLPSPSFRVDACLDGSSPDPVSNDVTEAGSGRLHAERSEGASVCYSMPSNGGTPCPASSPSRC